MLTWSLNYSLIENLLLMDFSLLVCPILCDDVKSRFQFFGMELLGSSYQLNLILPKVAMLFVVQT